MGDYAQKLQNLPHQLFISMVAAPQDPKPGSESHCGRYYTNLQEVIQCPKEFIVIQYETSEYKTIGEREDKAHMNKNTVK